MHVQTEETSLRHLYFIPSWLYNVETYCTKMFMHTGLLQDVQLLNYFTTKIKRCSFCIRVPWTVFTEALANHVGVSGDRTGYCAHCEDVVHFNVKTISLTGFDSWGETKAYRNKCDPRLGHLWHYQVLFTSRWCQDQLHPHYWTFFKNVLFDSSIIRNISHFELDNLLPSEPVRRAKPMGLTGRRAHMTPRTCGFLNLMNTNAAVTSIHEKVA